MIDPFVMTNKFLLLINGLEVKFLATFSILITLPRFKSTTIIFPSVFVKYNFLSPMANPIGLTFFLFLIL